VLKKALKKRHDLDKDLRYECFIVDRRVVYERDMEETGHR